LKADDRFETSDLCAPSPGLIFTAIVGEFDERPGDDLLVVKFEGLFLVSGARGGGFAGPAREAWAALERIRYGQATCGDVMAMVTSMSGSGSTESYDGGQMPTPYHHAG
jgi:hypothetical protein